MKIPPPFVLPTIFMAMSLAFVACKDDVSSEFYDTESDTAQREEGSDEEKTDDTATIGDDTVAQGDDTDSNEDSAIVADSDTTPIAPPGTLLIQAECAIDGTFSAACLEYTGTNSEIVGDNNWDGKPYPSLSGDGQLGYTDGGSWIAFAGIDLSTYSKVTIHYTCAEGETEDLETGFFVRLDAPDGEDVAIIETDFTDAAWDVYVDSTADIKTGTTGVHTVYFVANYSGKNNGNIDWISFHN
ncbi:MAG: carbohydrate-binding protein [Deltaproteobacteria bacterium]|nr:carbohydrate-binding protein [Deltaproteobacteria bacterium]